MYLIAVAAVVLVVYQVIQQLKKAKAARTKACLKEFQELRSLGDQLCERSRFKQGLQKYQKAYDLAKAAGRLDWVESSGLGVTLKELPQQIEREEAYEAALSQARGLARQSRYQEALTLLEKLIGSFDRPDVRQLIADFRSSLARQEQEFQALKSQADQKYKQLFFKDSRLLYQKAYDLAKAAGRLDWVESSDLGVILQELPRQIEREEAYEAGLSQARGLAWQSKYKEALTLLEKLIGSFDRPDGHQLIADFRAGLARQEQEFADLKSQADQKYKQLFFKDSRLLYQKAYDLAKAAGRLDWVESSGLGAILQELPRQIEREEAYEAGLSQARDLARQSRYKLARQSRYKEALTLLEKLIGSFDRPDGHQLIADFRAGLARQEQEFADLKSQADQKYKQLFFKDSRLLYQKAYDLAKAAGRLDWVESSGLGVILQELPRQIEREEAYEKVIDNVRDLTEKRRYQLAIRRLQLAQNYFPRPAGQALLGELQDTLQICGGKFEQELATALSAEAAGDWSAAQVGYKRLAPTPAKAQQVARRRLVIRVKQLIDAKLTREDTEELVQEVEHLAQGPIQDLELKYYLLGLAYIKVGLLPKAVEQWRHCQAPAVKNKLNSLQTFLDKNQAIHLVREIENKVDSGDLQAAQTISLKNLSVLSAYPNVKYNLENHIKPGLEQQLWQSQSWSTIFTHVWSAWQTESLRTPVTLHNLMVAAYYRAITTPSTLMDLIPILSTVLLNLDQDPSLKNIPWLPSGVNYPEISETMKSRLGELVLASNDLRIKDMYNLEMSVQEMSPRPEPRSNSILLSPGLYLRLFNRDWATNFTGRESYDDKVYKALYSSWGVAVAACLQDNVPRAMEIKPKATPNTPVTKFALSLVNYHWGCNQLRAGNWRSSLPVLEKIKSEINANPGWNNTLNELLGKLSQGLRSLEERLELGKFWYELLHTPGAKVLYVGSSVDKIRDDLAKEKISAEEGLTRLNHLRSIDPNNPMIVELIRLVKQNIELEQINREWQNLLALVSRGSIQQAVQRALASGSPRLKHALAELLRKIALEMVSSGNPSFLDLIVLWKNINDLE